MKLLTTYSGGDDLFEGDRTVQLRSLPIGARARTATVRLVPVASAGGTLFEEDIDHFVNGRGDISTTKVNGTDFVEVDFHARRTLAKVEGSTISGANLEVDVGGTLIEVNSRGALGGSGSDLFTLKADNALPGLTVNKFRLTRTGANPDVTTVTIRSVPTNLTVKLGQTPPFWVRVGELAGPETSPDFAEALNAFLLAAPSENGFYQIRFVIHSDTLARLDVELNIDYVMEQAVLPPHLPEINLSYDFSTLPSVDEALTTIRLPRAAVPVSGRTGAQIQGQFQPTRVARGPIGEDLIPVLVEVSPQCSLAQAIVADREIDVVGIDLPLGKTRADVTGLNVALRADDDGKPTGDVLVSAEVRVAKPIAGPSTWGTVTLPAPFRMLPNVRYWLVLQSRDNVATWNATAGQAVAPADPALPVQCSRDGGLSWRAATARDARQSLSALLRLREKPDRFSVPVQLQIGKGPGAVRRRLDEYAPSGRIEFNFDFAEKLTEHLSQPELASPCGAGELLVNGSFDDPPHDDATRRLFGFDEGADAGEYTYDQAEIVGAIDLSRGVDLSVERVISLSIDNGGSIRIDCAGPDPAHTKLEEVISAINRAIGSIVASENQQYLGGYEAPTGQLRITSPTTGTVSFVDLHPWYRSLVPQGWEGRPDNGTTTRRIKWSTAFLPNPLLDSEALQLERVCIALLAFSSNQTVLTQRAAVVGGCRYRLSVAYAMVDPSVAGLPPIGIDSSSFAEPRCEVRWLDVGEGVVREDLIRLERKPEEIAAKFPGMPPDSTSLLNFGMRYDSSSKLLIFKGVMTAQKLNALIGLSSEDEVYIRAVQELFHRSREFNVREAQLVSPEGAAQAVIRYVQPFPGFVLLDDASLKPVGEESINSAFHFWDTQDTAGQTTPSPMGWTIISGQIDPYPEDALLLGTIASGVILSGDGADDAVLAQRNEVVAGQWYELLIAARPSSSSTSDVDRRPIQQRARAELRWLNTDQPIGAPMSLPLDGRDFPDHAWSGPAPAGAHRAEVRLIQPRGRGNLIVESVSLTQIDQVDVPLIFLAETPGALTISNLRVTYDLPEKQNLLDAITSQPAAKARMVWQAITPLMRSTSTLPPITAIAGIGEARARRLAAIGIDTIDKLAAASPTAIAQAISGVTSKMASDFVVEAQHILASRHA